MNSKLKTLTQALIDEVNEVKGMKNTKQFKGDWWRLINWKDDEQRTVFDSLSDDTQQKIIEAGLCPDCPDKTEAPDEKKPKPEEKKGYSKLEEGKKEGDPEGKEIPKEAEKENPIPSELTEEEKKKLEEEKKKKLAQEEEDKKKKNCDTAPPVTLPKIPPLDPRKVLDRASKYLK